MIESPRVMFVGEDQELWPELLKSSAHSDWRLTFAHGGEEALVALDEQHFDAVIANLRLPGMTGAELLQEIRHRRPDVWRFLRAKAAAATESDCWAAAAHQLIDPPASVDAIQSKISHALEGEV